MDSVRFGRALGIGARAAAKTLVTAIDAATAPNPLTARDASAARDAKDDGGARSAQTPVVGLGHKAARATAQVRQTGHGLKQGSRRFGEAVWGPVVKLSGVLWLEFTGVFFGIFALFAGGGAWRMRGDWQRTATNHDAHLHLLIAAGMTAVFGYFCVSSFVRASRRGRRG